MALATQQGKPYALEQLAKRRANQPVPIDNSQLYAGDDMYFYCVSCGHLSDVLPEEYLFPPKKICKECDALKALGWLE